MKILNRKQSGFTLVELVVVVAVIGVLAVIAAPKIVGVATDARKASVKAVASTMTAAMARNYAAHEADSSTGKTIATCGEVTKILDGGILPSGYAFDATNDTIVIGSGEQATCYISTTSNPPLTSIFYGIGTAN
jgi:prepilin-type N-terminal cleavage/methylation domain-containing protein